MTTSLEPETIQAAIEYCFEKGWSDGLPLVPVTAEVIDRFLEHTTLPRDAVVARADNLQRICTAELAAVNAAMAGCRSEYFPVLLAALDALSRDSLGDGAGWQSTSSPAPLIVVNGEVRQNIGLNSEGGVFSPGFRANATIARAMGLIVRNVFGIQPHVLDQSTQGIPGRWAMCVGENEEESPWGPLSVERGLSRGQSAVSLALVRTCEYVDNRVTQDAEELLFDFADTISRTGAYLGPRGSCAVAFGLEHAQILADAGFTKQLVKEWLVAHCVRSTRDLERAGKSSFLERAELDGSGSVKLLQSDKNVPIFVVGSRNAAMSLVFRLLGNWADVSCPVPEG